MPLNGANTGFMLLAAALVMLMTPGLAFFYGGLVGRSNTLTIMIQSFASMGITTVMWWLVGYSLCFSGGKRRDLRELPQRVPQPRRRERDLRAVRGSRSRCSSSTR